MRRTPALISYSEAETMRTFAQKQLQSQQQNSSNLRPPRVISSAPSHRILRLQRSIGNQAVMHLLQKRIEDIEASPRTARSSHVGYDFSLIPLHAKTRAGVQSKSLVNIPGDVYEQEADRAADQVLYMPDARLQPLYDCGGDTSTCQNEQHDHEILQTSRPRSNDVGELAALPIVHEGSVSSVAGHSSGADPSVLYRDPVPTQTDPTFSIVGTPTATAAPDGTEVNSPNQVTLLLGDFVINARVQVQTLNAAILSDWEVGIVQMMSGAVDASCYQRPAVGGRPRDPRVFVEHMHAPTQMFHPDRDPASPVFYDSGSMIDLGASHGGRNSFSVPLHAEDHPIYRGVWGFASAHTHDTADTDVELTRHRHRGFFYTYVVARQKSTSLMTPLHTVRWWLASDYGYFSPGTGIDFTATNRASLTFRLIESHAFSPSDFFPVVTGETMQQLSGRREQGWTAGECPGFVELGGGQ